MMGHLRRTVEGELIVATRRQRDQCARLDGGAADALIDEVDLDHMRSGLEGRGNLPGIAAHPAKAHIIGCDIVDRLGARCKSGWRARLRGQDVVIDVDPFRCILRGAQRLRNRDRDRLADVTHLVRAPAQSAPARPSGCRPVR